MAFIETKEVLKPKSMGTAIGYAIRLVGREWPNSLWYHSSETAKSSAPSDRYEVVKVTIEVVG